MRTKPPPTISNKNLKKNEIFNLSSGKVTTIKQLINEILKVNNKKEYKIQIKKTYSKTKVIYSNVSKSYV